MQRHFSRSSAFAVVMAWAVAPCVTHAGGIPVIDVGNLTQNSKIALEAALQTAKQIEQYKLQFKQYEIMVKDAKVPTRNVWDNATGTMGRLLTAMDTLDQYREQANSLEKHLQQFKDVDGYQASSSSCASARCNGPNWSQMAQEQGRLGARSQKSANDALLRSLDQQQQTMRADAVQLEQLQQGAQGAEGQMQALGAANQLASHVAHQLQQIRALLIAQNTALAARQQAQAGQEALSLAAQKAALAPRMVDTPNRLNWLSIKP
ncbi:MAG: P-type conjugative transfer protein TrbJ [Comamonas sp.]